MTQSLRLSKSDKIKLIDGRMVTATARLGEGGQGAVYKVSVDDTGEEKALKWYHDGTKQKNDSFYKNLQSNIKTGSPSHSFVWPEELTEDRNGAFGYIMKIIPNEYKPFPSFLLAKVRPASYEALVNSTLNIVKSFKDLHTKGYNYQDLNDGNFFINPQNGDILICDNDNVMGHAQYSGILGKPRYMAPETVRGEKQPDKVTDRFSMAVILFMILVGDHPLEGKKTNVPALTNTYEKKFFGIEPLFVFDRHNNANMPVAGLHRNAIRCWPLIPSFIKEAFEQSFSQESLLKAEGRLLEQNWLRVLVQLKSSIVTCQHCSRSMFLDVSPETPCSCGEQIKPLGFIRFIKKRSNAEVVVPIFQGVKLYGYHIDERSEDYQTEVGTILCKPGKIGLANNTKNNWTITSKDGTSAIKKPGEVAVLALGFKIDFGNGNIAEITN